MNYLDLFSGIGGFALGAYNAGWRFDNHYYSEVDEYAIKVYQRRFPEAIPLGDITKIDGKALADSVRCGGPKSQESRRQKGQWNGNGSQASWFITGGFPCTDISIAGKGAGITGRQSGLWFEMWRLIRDIRPRYVIAENVGAITFRGLNRVLSSLAEIGYDAEWTDIRASDVGVPHRRERIWIVAYPGGERLEERQCQSGNDGEECQAAERSSQDVAHAERPVREPGAGRRGIREGDSQINGSDGTALGGLGLLADGLSPWLVEPDIPRVSRGEQHRVDKLKCLGNSIVPQIAEMIFRQLAECELTQQSK